MKNRFPFHSIACPGQCTTKTEAMCLFRFYNQSSILSLSWDIIEAVGEIQVL